MQKFTKADVLDLYKKLFSDEAYFYSLMQNDPSENIKKIWEFTRENLQADCLYYDDAIAAA